MDPGKIREKRSAEKEPRACSSRSCSCRPSRTWTRCLDDLALRSREGSYFTDTFDRCPASEQFIGRSLGGVFCRWHDRPADNGPC